MESSATKNRQPPGVDGLAGALAGPAGAGSSELGGVVVDDVVGLSGERLAFTHRSTATKATSMPAIQAATDDRLRSVRGLPASEALFFISLFSHSGCFLACCRSAYAQLPSSPLTSPRRPFAAPPL